MTKRCGSSSTKTFYSDRGGDKLSNDDSFLENGIIDSTGVLELVTFVEQEFPVTIDDDELIPDNLDSINNLVRFIETKLAEATE